MRRYFVQGAGVYFEITRNEAVDLLDDERYYSRCVEKSQWLIFTRRY